MLIHRTASTASSHVPYLCTRTSPRILATDQNPLSRQRSAAHRDFVPPQAARLVTPSAMYSGNAARIYNPQPDPLERGPPKRVLREEQHIGEMVAASKKRVTWQFTLGESDRTHEVVLVHSVMSYKKVGRAGGIVAARAAFSRPLVEVDG
jgi:hypothetical protein